MIRIELLVQLRETYLLRHVVQHKRQLREQLLERYMHYFLDLDEEKWIYFPVILDEIYLGERFYLCRQLV